jgi:hypothetical protein
LFAGLAKWYASRADEGEGAEGDLLHRLEFPVDSWDVMAGVLADPPAKGKEPVVGKGNLKVLMGISEEMRNHSAKIKLHLCGKQQPPGEDSVVYGASFLLIRTCRVCNVGCRM